MHHSYSVGVSVSEYVAVCQTIFTEANLNPQLHGYGTNVEGEWDEVMAALKLEDEKIHDVPVNEDLDLQEIYFRYVGSLVEFSERYFH